MKQTDLISSWRWVIGLTNISPVSTCITLKGDMAHCFLQYINTCDLIYGFTWLYIKVNWLTCKLFEEIHPPSNDFLSEFVLWRVIIRCPLYSFRQFHFPPRNANLTKNVTRLILVFWSVSQPSLGSVSKFALDLYDWYMVADSSIGTWRKSGKHLIQHGTIIGNYWTKKKWSHAQ